jgi:hypothetical protein
MKVEAQAKMVPRAVPPRREDHRIVPGSARPRRNFRITAGLREGWGQGWAAFLTFRRPSAPRGPGCGAASRPACRCSPACSPEPRLEGRRATAFDSERPKKSRSRNMDRCGLVIRAAEAGPRDHALIHPCAYRREPRQTPVKNLFARSVRVRQRLLHRVFCPLFEGGLHHGHRHSGACRLRRCLHRLDL